MAGGKGSIPFRTFQRNAISGNTHCLTPFIGIQKSFNGETPGWQQEGKVRFLLLELKNLCMFGRRSGMLNYNLNSWMAAKKLINMCEKYHDKMDIDVIHGRYVIDAYSVLGVHSLIGHVVTLDPQTDNKELIDQFAKDLESIK